MPKRRNLAHLRGLQAFEAVARHLSVTAAAEELGVTQSAVSHQLRQLSDFLGEILVERRGRSIVLTEAGRRLAESIGTAFDLVEQSAAAIIGRGQRVLRVAVYSSFAVGWLVPVLAEFRAMHSDIDVRLIMTEGDPELSDRLADAFITSQPSQRGFWSTRICPEILVPIGSGAIGAGLQQFPQQPLVTTDTDPLLVGSDWESFCHLNALTLASIRAGDWICCSHFIIALNMVRAGLGAALVPDFLAAEPIRRGEVFRLPGASMPTGLDYNLVIKFERRAEASLTAFAQWISKRANLSNS